MIWDVLGFGIFHKMQAGLHKKLESILVYIKGDPAVLSYAVRCLAFRGSALTGGVKSSVVNLYSFACLSVYQPRASDTVSIQQQSTSQLLRVPMSLGKRRPNSGAAAP